MLYFLNQYIMLALSDQWRTLYFEAMDDSLALKIDDTIKTLQGWARLDFTFDFLHE